MIAKCAGWWHQVDSAPQTIAVNMWYQGPREAVISNAFHTSSAFGIESYYTRLLLAGLVDKEIESRRAAFLLQSGPDVEESAFVTQRASSPESLAAHACAVASLGKKHRRASPSAPLSSLPALGDSQLKEILATPPAVQITTFSSLVIGDPKRFQDFIGSLSLEAADALLAAWDLLWALTKSTANKASDTHASNTLDSDADEPRSRTHTRKDAGAANIFMDPPESLCAAMPVLHSMRARLRHHALLAVLRGLGVGLDIV
jgi:hypothetical protein